MLIMNECRALHYSDHYVSSVLEFAHLGGEQHPMDNVFPLFPSNFTMDFTLSSIENTIICNK